MIIDYMNKGVLYKMMLLVAFSAVIVPFIFLVLLRMSALKGMIISIIKFNYQNFYKHLAEFKGILSAYFRLSSYYRISQYNL